MPEAIKEKTTDVYLDESYFNYFDTDRKDHYIVGSEHFNWSDDVTFKNMDIAWIWNPSNVDVYIDFGGGLDDEVIFEGDITALTLVSNPDDNGYDMKSTGGYKKGGDIKSMDVWYKDVDKVWLTDRDDYVDIRSVDYGVDIIAGSGDDTIYGSSGISTIKGGHGNDFIKAISKGNFQGGSGNDTINGSSRNDTISGGADNDSINGGAGNDSIKGGAGNDYLFGGGNADNINGEDGHDTILGGGGTDVLTGGSGSDTFVFDNTSFRNTITDLEQADIIRIEGYNPNDVTVSSLDSIDGLRLSLDGGLQINLSGIGTDRDVSIYDVGSDLEIRLNSERENDSVICTYMFERGYIPADVYKWDGVYGQRLGAEVLAGYHAWAIPLVEHVLKRSEIATQMVRPLACAWALEMAHRCDPESHPKGSLLGRAILTVGVPLCRMIARSGGKASLGTTS